MSAASPPPGTEVLLAELERIPVLVRRMTLAAEKVMSVELERCDGGPLPDWSPGAHVDVALPNGLVRQYSLCGEPDDRATWRIGVLRDERSRGGSAYIGDVLRPGDRLAVGPPRNNFAFANAPRYLFIAGGIGITPLVPMLKEAQARGKAWRLVYGGRRRASMAFLSELSPLTEKVQIFPEDECGLLDVRGLIDGLERGTAVYCCGPDGLLSVVERVVADRDDLELHVERFQARATAPASADDGFRAVLARSGTELLVAPGVPLLDVLEDAGLSVASACREGICGSCELRVLEGDVDHRDSVLSPAERAAGTTMMPCVSRAAGARVVLDL